MKKVFGYIAVAAISIVALLATKDAGVLFFSILGIFAVVCESDD